MTHYNFKQTIINDYKEMADCNGLDTEWNEAERANETPKYYKCSYKTYGGTHVFIKLYKPSLAELIKKITGWKMEEI